MKESDAYYSQGDSRQPSLSHQAVKKKCKKKKSPIEEDESRRNYSRNDAEYDSRRKDAKGSRRDYDDGESRRKENRKERGSEEKDSRRKEGREHYSEGGKKRCNKYRERRSPDRRRDGEVKSKVKEEILSDEEMPRRDRSRSPRSNHREESNRRKPNNLDSIMNVKEEKHNWGKDDDDDKKKPPKVNVAKPDFGLSGKLAEETNVVNGIVIKYSEPEEARKPRVRWRLYPFKGDSSLPVLHLHRQSAYLIGRDRKIADLPVDHPSCSKQHAILQYRLVPYTKPDGSQSKRIRPYILDLESANGTFVNNNKIEPKKYVELLERDVIKFAFSSREYVLLHEHSKDAHLDDDVQ